ncbi:hypothetical protein TEA_017396 [Camellia sinensis var. sinensis]|uniref:Uncharacterized protein n=2 Tax=Camellia sinensis TaxID=4442 RepID=A0A4S4DZ37_CAMSN|nr:hypothetical protein TEA_017396 [Camellia sinensis var. sinensis]
MIHYRPTSSPPSQHGYGRWQAIVDDKDLRVQEVICQELNLPLITLPVQGAFQSLDSANTASTERPGNQTNGTGGGNDLAADAAQGAPDAANRAQIHQDSSILYHFREMQRRQVEFIKKRVLLLEKALNTEYIKEVFGEEKTNVAPNGELETEAKVVNIPSSCSMEFGAQTMNDLPEVEVIPPEEVSAVACDDKPDRLKMAQLYNEMCKVLGQNANESMEAFLANKPAGFKLKKNLLPLETIYQDINRILSLVQQDSSSLKPQIQKADSHSETPTEIAGPNLLSTLQGDKHKSGPEAMTVESGPETECSNRSTTEPDFEKEKSNSPSCEVVPAAADSCPPQTEPICSTNGTGDDVEMEELRDADSSADEPTEESADKSDPGVIVLDD